MKILVSVFFVYFNVSLLAQNGVLININAAKDYQHKLNLSDFAESVEYIPLETTDKSLIGRYTTGCRVTKDYIFVSNSGGLLQFRRNGEFVRQVNQVGQGPGECFARFVAFDEKNQRIYMYNNYTYYIMVYGFDGKFKHKFNDPMLEDSDINPCTMDCDKNGNLFLSFDNSGGDMLYKYVVIDSVGNIIHKEPNYEIYKTTDRVVDFSMPFSPFFSYKGSLFYYSSSDTVFRVNQNYKCEPHYIIKIPNKMTLKDNVKSSTAKATYDDIRGKSIIGNMSENDRYVFIRHSIIERDKDKKRNYISLYDKKERKLTANISAELLNDIDGGINFSPISQNEDCMYTFIWPFEMKEQLTSAHFSKSKALYPEKQKALKTMVDKLLEDDNIVIMLIKLK
jgi:hypothetical protein